MREEREGAVRRQEDRVRGRYREDSERREKKVRNRSGGRERRD